MGDKKEEVKMAYIGDGEDSEDGFEVI